MWITQARWCDEAIPSYNFTRPMVIAFWSTFVPFNAKQLKVQSIAKYSCILWFVIHHILSNENEKGKHQKKNMLNSHRIIIKSKRTPTRYETVIGFVVVIVWFIKTHIPIDQHDSDELPWEATTARNSLYI